MKFVVLLLAAYCGAAPPALKFDGSDFQSPCFGSMSPVRKGREAPKGHVAILCYENETSNNGTYKFSYDTGDGVDGIAYSEEGVLKNAGSENVAQSSWGKYSYTAPNGLRVIVTWTADETGFHPKIKMTDSYYNTN